MIWPNGQAWPKFTCTSYQNWKMKCLASAIGEANYLAVGTTKIWYNFLLFSCARNEKKQKELINNLSKTYEKIHRKQKVPLADFPNEEMMCDNLAHHDFAEFKKFDKNHMKNVGGASFQILKIACGYLSAVVYILRLMTC